jgi:hypothetical protein
VLRNRHAEVVVDWPEPGPHVCGLTDADCYDGFGKGQKGAEGGGRLRIPVRNWTRQDIAITGKKKVLVLIEATNVCQELETFI